MEWITIGVGLIDKIVNCGCIRRLWVPIGDIKWVDVFWENYEGLIERLKEFVNELRDHEKLIDVKLHCEILSGPIGVELCLEVTCLMSDCEE